MNGHKMGEEEGRKWGRKMGRRRKGINTILFTAASKVALTRGFRYKSKTTKFRKTCSHAKKP